MIQIDSPVDAHVHFRQGRLMRDVVPLHALFEWVLPMPNTDPPIQTSEQASEYSREVRDLCGSMRVIQCVKITPGMDPSVFRTVDAGKLYPDGVTTNSHGGFTAAHLAAARYTLFPILEVMQDKGAVLCVHGEWPGSFCLDRERDFLPTLLLLADNFPSLRIVLEHVTSRAGVDLVLSRKNLAATVTLHHMVHTLDDVIGDVLSPHNFCKPVPKREDDRRAILAVVRDGCGKFFFGSDSAPHTLSWKLVCGCAGCFTAPCLLPALAALFEAEKMLHRLNGFLSEFARSWYALPKPSWQVKLERGRTVVPNMMAGCVPWGAGRVIPWEVIS